MSPWMRSAECSFATAPRSPAPPLPHRLAIAKLVDVLHLHIVSRSTCRQRLGPIQTLLCTDSRSYGRRAFKIMASTDVTVTIIALFSFESAHVVSLQRFARSDGKSTYLSQRCRPKAQLFDNARHPDVSVTVHTSDYKKVRTRITQTHADALYSCVCHSGSDLKIKDATQTQSRRIR